MSNNSDLQTGTTLLNLLREFSDQAWIAFVERYGPCILQWCRGWRLQEADAENVTQEVLIKLFQKVRTFTYNPSKGAFRSWLKTVAHHAWQDYLDGQRRLAATGAGGSAVLEKLHTAEARPDLAQALEVEFDLELLEEAKRRVRSQVSDRDWQIFHEVAVDRRRAAEVAGKHGMMVAAVYMVKSRVAKQLREVVAALEQTAQKPDECRPSGAHHPIGRAAEG
jgi:RNA polymerase sigma-70 factor (ECF subfamily)